MNGTTIYTTEDGTMKYQASYQRSMIRNLGLIACLAFSGIGLIYALPPGIAELPGVDELPAIEDLPDPFLMNDGTRVATPVDWEKRRAEIMAMLLYYQYGHLPPPPSNLTAKTISSADVLEGRAVESFILLTMGPDRSIPLNLRMVLPKGAGPFPVVVVNVNDFGAVPILQEMIERGYAIVEYRRTDLDPDARNTVGPAEAAYPDYDWGTLAIWAWGGHRVVDYLLTLENFDPKRIAMTGHSRGGKTALLAGALDERIALVVPNGSGCGGAGCYRVKEGESLEQITNLDRFFYWFTPRFRTFAERETHLPFDQHFLKALVAPRALLSTDGLEDHWANPPGTQQTYLAVQPVYDFLNASDKNGIHFREGKHAHNEEDWRALADFADWRFFGKKVERDFKTLPFPDAEKLFSWTAPKRER